MPNEIRYARAAIARRSPKARLYSAVPRSSQWPSTVTAQLVYRFSSAAFSSSVFWFAALRSLLSSSKYTGFSGEFLFKSSSDADEIASSRTGSGGTATGSRTGSGGDGGRAGAVPGALAGGGGMGRARGGIFLWHAARVISATSASAVAVSRAGFIGTPVIWTSQVFRYCRSW